MMPALARLTLLLVASALCAASARAEEKPLWEFGLGGGLLLFNDYRGSDTTHVYPLPLPYFIYRGEFLKSDRDGVRGLLFNQQFIELNLSVNATTPVLNDSARHGMPDLRSTLEIGPSLDAHLWRSADARVKLDLRLPVRAALTVQAVPHYVGIFFAPNLSLDIAQFRGEYGWKLGLLAGPLFANRRYDDYFYTVAPQYATADRPAYSAPGGYAGSQALVSLTRRYPKFWVGVYARHDSLADAAFADSPLVKRASYWRVGCGVAWMIAASSRLVESPE
jgi:outer membrane protein